MQTSIYVTIESKKMMMMLFKRLWILGLFSLFVLADTPHYHIKLAAYKNLSSLNKQISTLPSILQKDVEIKKENGVYRAFLKIETDKASLIQILPSYQKVFADAFISTVQNTETLSSSAIGAPILGSKFYYTIKLAVYKNLSSLDHQMSKLTPALQKKVVIKKENDTYKAFLKTHTDKTYLTQLLPGYQKVFADAFVAKVDASKVSNYSEPLVEEKPKTPSKKTPFSYDKIQNHSFYICPDIQSKHNYLLHIAFKKNRAKYLPITGNARPFVAQYKIKEQKLYIYKSGAFDHNIYYTLEEKFPKYYLVHAWIGKVKINALRYYFTLKDAKTYLNHSKEKMVENNGIEPSTSSLPAKRSPS